jgi:hypothetical protein
LHTSYKLTALILFLVACFALAGCGKKAEEPGTAKEAGTAAASAAPGAPAGNAAEAFAAKVAEVDAYMSAHDVKNTPAKDIAATLETFQQDFTALAARAGGDEELAGRCALAAEAMGLYVQSLRAPADDLGSLQLAIDAEVKWTRAKGTAPGGPES